MVTASAMSERAAELEHAADAAELHEATLAESHGERIVAVFEAAFAALGLPLPVAVLECALRGEVIEEELAASERELVLRGVRVEVERELEAARFEVSRPVAVTDPPGQSVKSQPVNSGEVIEPVEQDGLPSWESLPEEWKQRHLLNPTLARSEYARALKAEENAARRAGPGSSRRSRHVIPRHPGV